MKKVGDGTDVWRCRPTMPRCPEQDLVNFNVKQHIKNDLRAEWWGTSVRKGSNRGQKTKRTFLDCLFPSY